MPAILDPDIMTADEQHEAMTDAERDLHTEAFFQVAEADAKLRYALDHLDLFVKPAVQPGMVDSQTYAYVVGKIAEARALIRRALTAVDVAPLPTPPRCD
jgi:hypothetical protein